MKKLLAIILVIGVVFSFVGCSKGTDSDSDEIVIQAIADLKEYWRWYYNDAEYDTDGYFAIKNTRVIHIKPNSLESFRDVTHIIEFVLHTDYFGSAPYYSNNCGGDSVSVHKDGSMSVNKGNPIDQYRALTYNTDYSGFVQSVEDLGDKYNCSEYLK